MPARKPEEDWSRSNTRIPTRWADLLAERARETGVYGAAQYMWCYASVMLYLTPPERLREKIIEMMNIRSNWPEFEGLLEKLAKSQKQAEADRVLDDLLREAEQRARGSGKSRTRRRSAS